MKLLLPPTRDLCHLVQLAALRHGWQIRCDGRHLWIVKGAAAGVLIGELALVAGMYL